MVRGTPSRWDRQSVGARSQPCELAGFPSPTAERDRRDLPALGGFGSQEDHMVVKAHFGPAEPGILNFDAAVKLSRAALQVSIRLPV